MKQKKILNLAMLSFLLSGCQSTNTVQVPETVGKSNAEITKEIMQSEEFHRSKSEFAHHLKNPSFRKLAGKLALKIANEDNTDETTIFDSITVGESVVTYVVLLYPEKNISEIDMTLQEILDEVGVKEFETLIKDDLILESCTNEGALTMLSAVSSAKYTYLHHSTREKFFEFDFNINDCFSS